MLYINHLEDFMCFSDKLPTFLKSYRYDLGLSYYLQALEKVSKNLLSTYKIIYNINSNVSPMLYTRYLFNFMCFSDKLTSCFNSYLKGSD